MTNRLVIRVMRFASLLFGDVFAGFLVGVLVLELSLWGYDAAVYTEVRHVELVGLDVLATFTLLPSMIATGVVVIAAAKRRGSALWLPLSAMTLLLTVFVITLAVNLPINAAQPTWDVQAPPGDWIIVRDRWQVAHAVRTGAAVLAFCLLSVAAMVRPAPTRAS